MTGTSSPAPAQYPAPPAGGLPRQRIYDVEHPALARLLKLAFEYLWDCGEDFR